MVVEALDPLPSRLAQQKCILLDGGLATELERLGCELDHHLWSARVLAEEPAKIRQAHVAYAKAGAEVLITSPYQASVPGFRAAGYTEAESRAFLQRSVDLAQVSSEVGRKVLVAASVGPYGAYLADGSEFRGNYGTSARELREWHRSRLEILQGTGADLLAMETIPSEVEALALAELLDDVGHVRAWMSFSCRSAEALVNGVELERVVPELSAHPQIVALGVNCLSPDLVTDAVKHLRSLTDKPILAYPNAGETYDVDQGQWTGLADVDRFAQQAEEWQEAGCALIGGCCRTTPEHIATLRATLEP